MSDNNNIPGNTLPEDKPAGISLNAQGKQPGADKLMSYLDGELSADEQHDMELWLSEEGMESDALEGLKMLDTAETKHSVHRLNHSLNKTLSKKKERRKAKNDPNTVIAVMVIILLIVVAYLVIRIVNK